MHWTMNCRGSSVSERPIFTNMRFPRKTAALCVAFTSRICSRRTASTLSILPLWGRLLDYKDATGDRPETERTHTWQEPEREATLEEIAAYCRRTGAYFNNQAANPANSEAHYRPTGPEIWQDTEKNLDVLVCMAGTGFGTARYLREQNPALKIVLVQPHPDSRLTAEHPDVPIIDGVLPVYGVPESELSDYLRPEGLFLFIHHNIR